MKTSESPRWLLEFGFKLVEVWLMIFAGTFLIGSAYKTAMFVLGLIAQ